MALFVLAGTASAVFLEIALDVAAVNFLNLTLDFLFLQNISFDLEAVFTFVGLLSSSLALVAATTVSAAILPLIWVVGFAYYVSIL